MVLSSSFPPFIYNFLLQQRHTWLPFPLIYLLICSSRQCTEGFPGGTRDKEPTCQCRRLKRHRFDPWVRKIPWRMPWQPTPVFLPGKSKDREAWWAIVHRVARSWTWVKRLSITCMHLPFISGPRCHVNIHLFPHCQFQVIILHQHAYMPPILNCMVTLYLCL